MSDKELEEYIRTIDPNFNSNLEKGTIEMSNEYYNLLEERMARLINEHQELKKQVDYLRRSVERKEETIIDLQNERVPYTNEYVAKLENQQKEFILYLEKEKERCLTFYSSTPCMYAYDAFKEILSKYKEIIGGKE